MKLEMTKKMKSYIVPGCLNTDILKDLHKYLGIGEYKKGTVTNYQNYQIKYKNEEFDLYFNYDKRSIIMFDGNGITDVSELPVWDVVEKIKLWQIWVKDKEMYIKEQKLKEMF
jgi:hypothetical protein